MNGYCVSMKAQGTGPLLRKMTEAVAQERLVKTYREERFFDGYALLAVQAEPGWAIGVRVNFSETEWSVAEVVALPREATQGAPDLNSAVLWSYLEKAVGRARGRHSAMLKRLESTRSNSDFIESRFATWSDKAAPRGNVEYAALAAKYAEQIRLGNTKATATLAEQVGMSPSVMAQRIKEARRRLLLSQGEQGRASGTLTTLGAIYTDPDFPGMRELWKSGMPLREIADKYGVDENHVWVAMQAERPENGIRISFEDFIANTKEGE